MITVSAIFEDGVFKPDDPVDISTGTRVQVILPTPPADAGDIMRARFPLSFGAISDEDAAEMTRAIEEECERVDTHDD